ncbi:MAG: hypothetical protein NE328_22530 [Lentisphaeraceae bacterium]|nr:hypothetical protein [Lentisphaeraceae bacterium]
MIKKLFFSFTVLLFLTSCGLQKELPIEVSKSLVSIHRIDKYGVETKLVVPIMVDGQKLFISRIPLLSNKDMVQASTFQYREDAYGLDLRLTRHGANRWQQSQVEFRGMQAILAVGGKFKCFIKIGKGGTALDYKIAAPLTKEEADEMAKNIGRNYEAIKELN